MRIVLAWNDVPYDGDSIGSSDGAARPRLVGEATLRGVERIIGDGTHLDLSGVATTDLGTARVAIAEVRLEGSLDSLVGSAVIRENDPAKATARAVLDAVNRRRNCRWASEQAIGDWQLAPGGSPSPLGTGLESLADPYPFLTPHIGVWLSFDVFFRGGNQRWHRNRSAMLVNRHHRQVGSRRLFPFSGTRVLSPHAHLYLHRRPPRLCDHRVESDEITDMHGSKERERIDLNRHDPAVAMPHGSDAGCRIDEFHDLPAMNETSGVGKGELHHNCDGGHGLGR